MTDTITIEDVQAAAARINVHRTPVLTSTAISSIASENAGVPLELFFKCELLQKTGSFKIRGATNAVQLLTDADAGKGVVTHSSGNHAQALALAARMRGIPAYVVMPNNSPQVKKDAVKAYGAQVIECEPTLEQRETTAQKVIDETGATFIHPYNNPHVIAGQGTIALETVAQEQQLDALVVPVGGGGMLSGCSIATKALSPRTRVFAAEPLDVNDTYRSYAAKERVTNTVGARSVADGLLTNLGEIAFSVVMENVDGVFVVTEKEIIQAMQLVWGRMKLCIEPSAAVGLAVVLYNKDFHARVKQDELRRIGIILCGGNVDFANAVALFEKFK
ncbi:tryptophan synthase beta subunit-like PLP-dependent enzyme [Zychaea mexicana]|uniref:tryptophan synthase beta subunit-like PLP-dependent enzyme n=1 Tax=Zychaea mexicana TaxID=64656 RepID=UPI0022FEBB46|nr:tryptophan synthase beta subunit-like PLP-dependent enzyme [Zychaea mexicana]KAI9492912.1 tryptophan synthase beta subunit-like PLP-dependent enzyme [Zychaea mexicana]